ncbi:MAG TPA: error-prone DNA polymerase [Rhizomicrobium sp.]|nr:error-prone DNA polymerase [Rhizomicrobium sp.]
MSYAELAVTTNFSFLRGASHPHEYAQAARLYGLAAIGIADRNTLAGVVRAYDALSQMAQEHGNAPKLLVGARLVFVDGTPDILAYPTDRAAYGRLCRLLSAGKSRAAKGECLLAFDDLLAWQEGLLLAVIPPPPQPKKTNADPVKKAWNKKGAPSVLRRCVPLDTSPIKREEKTAENILRFPPPLAGEGGAPRDLRAILETLRAAAPDRVWLAASMPHRGDDQRRMHRWKGMAKDAGVPLLAINDVLYHVPERRELQDVITCIREHVTLNDAGRILEANAERHLKPPEEMARLFRDAPEVIGETVRFAGRIAFSLDQLKYNYPDEPVPKGKMPQEHLEELTWKGAAKYFPEGLPENLRGTLAKELALIKELDIAPYFLTVHDIVQFARSQGILCQGRGSAANSAVCYVLGITAVDPTKIDLLFERFVSQERKEPPDIDVDFEHERREEVIQNIYERYGTHRAALAATVIRYRPRSAIRETGKVFGLTEDVTANLASGVWGSWGSQLEEFQVQQGGFSPGNDLVARAVKAANELIGFPRHLSQHVGGFVLTRDRLDELVPVGPATMEDRYFIEWDKDDIDALKMMKVDVLALGMLTCIRKAFDLMRRHEKVDMDLARVPREDPAVYEMLGKADAIGVFQVESRAQLNMLPRLAPKCFYDLVIEVAIVRPGPIQGDMVHPYLRRRSGKEKIEYPSPSPEHGPANELHRVLHKTLGVPLFQEQAMKLAIVAAGFTPSEANGLRRAMATFRNLGTIDKFGTKMIAGMMARGYTREFAERCFKQIEGFGSYGFPESHAASFAHLVYISAWIKKHYPAVFACALLNSQPMGFYAPAEIVRDAREHGVEILPPDVNFSDWNHTLVRNKAGALAMRLGFRLVDGLGETLCMRIMERRGQGDASFRAFARQTQLPRRVLVILAEADALRSFGLERREALWAVRRMPDDAPLPLFAAAEELPQENAAPLPCMPLSEQVLADYQMMRLSLKGHLLQFLRELFRAEGIVSCHEIAQSPDGAPARCAGLVLTRQMPGDAGVVFVTLNDETGIANVVVWPRIFETFRRAVMSGRLLVVEGKVQRSPEGVVHLVAERILDRTHDLDRLSEDEVQPVRPQDQMHRHPRNVRAVPKSRDFH